MKKITFILTLFFLIPLYLKAQSTGSFQETIQFNNVSHTLAYYVPTTYNSSNSYKLVVALHGCGGNAIGFRNSLISISDSLNAIILCPDFMGNQMSGSNGEIIPNSIDTTINQLGYNIDTSQVYLIGFSCNGQETFKQGWNGVYSFAGLIPFNAWIPSIDNSYNFNSETPTCICTGNQDGSYNNNVNLHSNLINNGGTGKLNTMPGIGHVWSFSTRDEEIMECFNWMDSLQNGGTAVIDNQTNENYFQLFQNAGGSNLTIKNLTGQQAQVMVYNINGQVLSNLKIATDQLSINTASYSKGLYFLVFQTNEGEIYFEKFMKTH